MQTLLERQLPIYQGIENPDPAAIDALLSKYQTRIDINEATEADLLWLGVPDSLVRSFMDYRQQYGPFRSLYELAAIQGFDYALANVLRWFFIDSPSLQLGGRQLSDKWQKKGLMNAPVHWMQARVGTTARANDDYPRQPMGQLLRYRLRTDAGLAVGLTMQQDAGEYYRWNPGRSLYGPDFISGYAATGRISPRLRELVVGDYTTSFGHRLLTGAGLSAGRGSMATTPLEGYQDGLRPYTSTAEYGFMRGVAMDWDLGPRGQRQQTALGNGARLMTYLSYKQIDASPIALQDSILDEGYSIGSLPASGIHVTAGQLARRATLSETIMGGQYLLPILNDYGQAIGRIGASLQQTIYGQPLAATTSRRFMGQASSALTIYGSRRVGAGTYAGEVAGQVADGRLATVGLDNLAISLSYIRGLNRYRTMTIRLRNYGNNYYAPYAAAFGQGSAPVAEQGIHLGAEQSKQIGWAWSGWLDVFRFSTLRYRISRAGVIGLETMTRVGYATDMGAIYASQYRLRVQPLDNLGNTTGMSNMMRQVAQVSGQIPLTADLSWSSVLQATEYQHWRNGPAQYGVAINTSLAAKWPRWRKFRAVPFMCYYDVSSSQARPFLTEPQVMWYQQLPYLNGRGLRVGLLMKAEVSNGLQTELRMVGDLLQPDRQEVMVQLTYNLAKALGRMEEQILLW